MCVGMIPESMSNLVQLRLLSLGEYTGMDGCEDASAHTCQMFTETIGGNSFSPAALPNFLSTLVKLEALFVANCSITGELPVWFDRLTELRQLDLQRNALVGMIIAGAICLFA